MARLLSYQRPGLFVFVLIVGVLSISGRASGRTVITPVKGLEVTEANAYGIAISSMRVAGMVFVQIDVEEEFPCKLDSVRVATFDGSRAILATTIRPDNGIYMIQVSEKYIGQTRIDLKCLGRSKENYAGYYVTLAGLKPDV